MLLGVTDTKKLTSREQMMFIENVAIHEKYNYSDGSCGYFDVGIIKLTKDIEYDNLLVQPICLPEKEHDLLVGKTGIISGYAHRNDDKTQLSSTTMAIMSIKRCNEILDDEIERINECKLHLGLTQHCLVQH